MNENTRTVELLQTLTKWGQCVNTVDNGNYCTCAEMCQPCYFTEAQWDVLHERY